MSRSAVAGGCVGALALARVVQAQDEPARTPTRRRASPGEATAPRYGGSRDSRSPYDRPPATDDSPGSMAGRFPRRSEVRDTKSESTLQSIVFDVVIADLAKDTKGVSISETTPEKLLAKINDLEQAGALQSIGRARLATIDQQNCMVQIGQRQAVVSGRRFSGDRNSGPTSYTYENTGTMIMITARVERDNSVLAEISVERSQIEPRKSKEKDAADADVPPSSIGTINARTTVRINNNATAVLSGVQVAGKDDAQHTIVLVTAHVSGEPLRAAAAAETTESSSPREARTDNSNTGGLLLGKEHASDAKSADSVKSPETREGDAPRLNSERTFIFKNRKAAEIAKVIGPLFAGDAVRVTVDDRTNTLFIRANTEVMQKIEATLEELDKIKPAQR
jgi:type II secretory pathway component GspD/PulD (secretin)